MKLVNQPNTIAQGTGLSLSRRGFLGVVCGLAATAIGCESMYQGPQLPPDTYLPPTPPNTNVNPPSPTVRPFSQLVLAQGVTALPARYTSSLANYQGQILGVETVGGGEIGDRNHIYNLSEATSFLELTDGNHSLNHLTVDSSGNRAALTANDGFFYISPKLQTKKFTSFPDGKNFGGGAVFVQNKLAIATANAEGVDSNNAVIYGDGTILIYDVDDTGIQNGSPRVIPTSGKNPTGLALLNETTLIVLNSGDYQSGDGASIVLIDISSGEITKKIDLREALGGLTAQVSGKIALSKDKKTVVIGTSSRDINNKEGRVLFVNLDGQNIVIKVLDGTTFHSNVEIDEGLSVGDNVGVVEVTDFNTGTISILDLVRRGLLQTLQLNQTEAGPAILVNGKLTQTIPYGALEVYPE